MSRVEAVEELAGRGVCAQVDHQQVCAGNDKLMAELGIEIADQQYSGTVVHVAIDKRYAGFIVISFLPFFRST